MKTVSNHEVFSSRAVQVAGDVLLCSLFALLTGLAAQVKVPVPGTTVPMTLQTAVVLASGLFLGSRRGAFSQAMYLTAGALGMPFFAGGALGAAVLFGPHGGYLVGFVLAAYFCGKIAHFTESFLATWALAFASSLIILGLGATVLGVSMHLSLAETLSMGVLPFLFGDVLKVTAVVLAKKAVRK